MSEKPRRWLQIHLSTAIVLMFVAGGMLWANIHIRKVNLNNGVFLFYEYLVDPYYGRGWPFVFDYGGNPEISLAALALNTLVAIVALSFCAVLLEYFIRREARKP